MRNYSRTAGCIVMGMVVAAAGIVNAATPQQVNDAIDRGIKFLYSRQNNGSWDAARKPDGKPHETTGAQWGGVTAIATYALLAARESPQNAQIKQGVQFLYNTELIGTYALGMRSQVWNYLPRGGEKGQGVDIRAAVRRDAQMLIGANLSNQGDPMGMFHYMPEQKNKDFDCSCSNYGVLGIWALAQSGLVEVPTAVWEMMDGAWRKHQNQDGGWSYEPGRGGSTISMTTAAVATLFITQDYLHAAKAVKCEGNVQDPNIERGIAWISQNFNKFQDGGWAFYSLYNIERVGVAGGYKYFGTVDWYKVGADWLVGKQGGDGSWDGDVARTCWAILFLVRGRAPVMINKLAYEVHTAGDKGKVATWNERPRDIANITRHAGKLLEKDFNWQIVNLKVNVTELHDAPVLYIAGKEALNFTKEEEAKLKQYVEEGGIIVGNADCGNLAFANSFKKLGVKLFGNEFRELPEDHSIYTDQQFKKKTWRARFSLQGITNGARELMLLFPLQDPAKGWQVQAFSGNEREATAQAMADIFLYSVSKQNLRYKGETYIVNRNNGVQAGKTISVARLQYAGNWDPEPGGWRRLANVMHNQHKTDLKVETVKLGEGKLNKNYQVAHLTGTSRLTLNAAARAEIKKYVQEGGTLVVDATGGMAEFGLAAEKELRDIFGNETKLGILGTKHAVFSAANKIEEVEYRMAARKLIGNIKLPRLRGEEIGGRVAIFLSTEDLSVGLVGNPVDGIVGYSPSAEKAAGDKMRAGASEVMANILIYAGGK